MIIDLRTKVYYPNNNNVQSMTFPDGTSVLVYYNVVIPYIDVRKFTKYEVEDFEQIALT